MHRNRQIGSDPILSRQGLYKIAREQTPRT
jgi:hypothetical protein